MSARKKGIILLAAFLGVLALILVLARQSFPIESIHPLGSLPSTDDGFTRARLRMVDQTLITRGIQRQDVIDAMRTVPREKFVPPEYQDMAYDDRPLPIGYGQTISQPYIVALMTELIDPKPGDKVLEIGTGSGYQAAILAQLGYLEVYSVEIIPELASRAARQLEESGYSRVKLKQADGYYGRPENGPYNAILVTAAPDHLPTPLV